MTNRLLIALAAAPLLIGGAAFAGSYGSTSGPSSGKNVESGAAIQKQGHSADEMKTPGGAGAPGAPARPGAQSGEKPMGSDMPKR